MNYFGKLPTFRICDFHAISQMNPQQLVEFLTTGDPIIFPDRDAIDNFTRMRCHGAGFLLLTPERLKQLRESQWWMTDSTMLLLSLTIDEAYASLQEYGTNFLTGGAQPSVREIQAESCRVFWEKLGRKSKAINTQPLLSTIQKQVDILLVPPNSKNTIMKLLGDPTVKMSLPFVSPGPIPDGFSLDNEGNFQFYGRKVFQTLFETISEMDPRKNRHLYLEGALGTGKSHIIAASVVALRKEGNLVCYIPDTYELLMASPPAQCLLEALYFTFEGDVIMQRCLRDLAYKSLASEEKLESSLGLFCARAAAEGKMIIFVIDQADALDDDLDDGVYDQKSRQVRALMNAVSHRHVKVEGRTANNRGAKHGRGSLGEKRLTLNQGLDDDEMRSWWESTTKELQWELPEADMRAFERLTGRMPILLTVLKSCVMNGRTELKSRRDVSDRGSRPEKFGCKFLDIRQRMASSTEVESLHHSILDFGLSQMATLKDREEERDIFLRALRACIFEMPVSRDDIKYLDVRYFYVDERFIGRSTSDFAREVAATILERSSLSPTNYGDKSWTRRLSSFAGNPSILGLAIKKIAIANLITNGTDYADRHPDPNSPKAQFGEGLRYIRFHGPVPPPFELYPMAELDGKKTRAAIKVQGRMEQRLIYVPAIFNYPSVDCVLVFMPGTEDKSAKVDKNTTTSTPRKKRKKTDNTAGSPAPQQLKRSAPSTNSNTDPKAVVVGVQFIISDNHRQTELPFLQKWRDWDSILPWDGEVEHRFLWVFDKIPQGYSHDWQHVAAKESPTRSGNADGRIVHPEYYTRSIEFKDLDKHLGGAIDRAKIGN